MIRRATTSDLPDMVVMGAHMHEESNYRHLRYDPLKLFTLLSMELEDYRAWVSETDGVLDGMLVCVKHEHFFCEGAALTELLLYVSPERRGGMTAYRLIKEMVKWGEEIGAVEMSAGVSTGIATGLASGLYGKFGFENVGPILKKRG